MVVIALFEGGEAFFWRAGVERMGRGGGDAGRRGEGHVFMMERGGSGCTKELETTWRNSLRRF